MKKGLRLFLTFSINTYIERKEDLMKKGLRQSWGFCIRWFKLKERRPDEKGIAMVLRRNQMGSTLIDRIHGVLYGKYVEKADEKI